MKTISPTHLIITAMLFTALVHPANANNIEKEKIDSLASKMQRKHLNTSDFLGTIRKLIKTPASYQYLEQKLISILTKHPAAGSRMRAAWLLGEIKSKRAIPYLVKAKRDKHRWVRRTTAHALKRIKSNADQ